MTALAIADAFGQSRLATNHVGVNVDVADLRLRQAHLLGDGKNLLLCKALELLPGFPHVGDAETGVGLRRPVLGPDLVAVP